MVQRCTGNQADLGAKEHGWSRACMELRMVLTPEGGAVSCIPSTKPSELLRPPGCNLALCCQNLLAHAAPWARLKGSG